MRNSDAEIQLRTILKTESGWSVLNAPKNIGENGADVLAAKDETLYFIEVIGYKSSGPARSKGSGEAFLDLKRQKPLVKHRSIMPSSLFWLFPQISSVVWNNGIQNTPPPGPESPLRFLSLSYGTFLIQPSTEGPGKDPFERI